jgi:hypothetical protein
MKIVKNSYLLVLYVTLLAYSSFTQAQQHDSGLQWYEIELIVFTINDPNALTAERWREPASFPGMENAVELVPGMADPADTAFHLLPAEQMQLNDDFNRLANVRRYTPRVHVAWRQPVTGRNESTSVQIHSRYPLPASYMEKADIPSLLDQISGTVTISVERYLHVDAQLLYTRPPALTEASANIPVNFVLKESRRLRSKEVHYLDHPMFGMLIQIVPYERPKPAAITAPAVPTVPGSQ